MPQVRQSLHPGKLRRGDVGLELKHLELDLQQIVLADVTRLVARFGNVHGVLKTLQILVRQLQSRFGKLNIDELRSNIESKTALVVGDLGPAHRRHVLGRLQAVLPLLAALEQIADAEVKLRGVVEVIAAEIAGLEDRQELRVTEEHRVRTQVGRCFFGLVLLNHGAGSHQIVVVLERHLNGVVKRDDCAARLGHRCICLRRRWVLGGRGLCERKFAEERRDQHHRNTEKLQTHGQSASFTRDMY